MGKCVPGFDLDLQEEERQRRANREVIPGDSYFHNHPPEDTEADEGDAYVQPSEQTD